MNHTTPVQGGVMDTFLPSLAEAHPHLLLGSDTLFNTPRLFLTSAPVPVAPDTLSPSPSTDNPRPSPSPWIRHPLQHPQPLSTSAHIPLAPDTLLNPLPSHHSPLLPQNGAIPCSLHATCPFPTSPPHPHPPPPSGTYSHPLTPPYTPLQKAQWGVPRVCFEPCNTHSNSNCSCNSSTVS